MHFRKTHAHACTHTHTHTHLASISPKSAQTTTILSHPNPSHVLLQVFQSRIQGTLSWEAGTKDSLDIFNFPLSQQLYSFLNRSSLYLLFTSFLLPQPPFVQPHRLWFSSLAARSLKNRSKHKLLGEDLLSYWVTPSHKVNIYFITHPDHFKNSELNPQIELYFYIAILILPNTTCNTIFYNLDNFCYTIDIMWIISIKQKT